MKKMLLGLLVALVAVNLFAQTEAEAKTEKESDPYLIESILKKQFKTDEGKKRVYELSENLTNEQKMYLYNKYDKSGVGPFFLNFFLGFGIGSFVQGNTKAGVSQLILNVSGCALEIVGAVLAINSRGEENTWEYWGGGLFLPASKPTFNAGQFVAGYACVAAGAGLNLGSGISGCITPWTYAAGYNKDLKRALRINESPWMTVTPQLSPIIDPVNQNYGLVAKINF